MIVQTCTIEGSVGDVVKSVSCAGIKTWPGKSKVRESRWSLRVRQREHSNQRHWRCLSVSSRDKDAIAVNVKHQIDMIRQDEEIMKSVAAGECREMCPKRLG